MRFTCASEIEFPIQIVFGSCLHLGKTLYITKEKDMDTLNLSGCGSAFYTYKAGSMQPARLSLMGSIEYPITLETRPSTQESCNIGQQ